MSTSCQVHFEFVCLFILFVHFVRYVLGYGLGLRTNKQALRNRPAACSFVLSVREQNYPGNWDILNVVGEKMQRVQVASNSVRCA